MEKIKSCSLFALTVLLGVGTAQAGEYDWDDLWGPYTRRIDRATPSSGNAQNVNTATHMINPWPPYVHDRRISGDGSRMVEAVKRYREPNKASSSSSQLQHPSSGLRGQPGGGSQTGGASPNKQNGRGVQ